MIEIGNAKIYIGDVIQELQEIPPGSVHCVVTSPPYWGLRNYDQENNPDMIGLEPTFQEWLDKMVEVCREVKRVLRPDGTFWLNCGDAYAGGKGKSGSRGSEHQEGRHERGESLNKGHQDTGGAKITRPTDDLKALRQAGFKPKDLLMMPARLAIALQEDGWWVRSEIIWAKPNPMPESVTDRPISSHEKIYLLTKNPRYFYDCEAVREHGQDWGERKPKISRDDTGLDAGQNWNSHRTYSGCHPSGRNLRNVWREYDPNTNEVIIKMRVKRKDLKKYGFKLDAMPNVWEIATQPYKESHFAVYPEKLVEKCILAGTSDKGCCPECGASWVRVVEKKHPPSRATKSITPIGQNPQGYFSEKRYDDPIEVKTLGWQPTCVHGVGVALDPIPCTVLDPFAGSGTTLKVALELNRRAIGIELNEAYVRENLIPRIHQEASQGKLW